MNVLSANHVPEEMVSVDARGAMGPESAAAWVPILPSGPAITPAAQYGL